MWPGEYKLRSELLWNGKCVCVCMCLCAVVPIFIVEAQAQCQFRFSINHTSDSLFLFESVIYAHNRQNMFILVCASIKWNGTVDDGARGRLVFVFVFFFSLICNFQYRLLYLAILKLLRLRLTPVDLNF